MRRLGFVVVVLAIAGIAAITLYLLGLPPFGNGTPPASVEVTREVAKPETAPPKDEEPAAPASQESDRAGASGGDAEAAAEQAQQAASQHVNSDEAVAAFQQALDLERSASSAAGREAAFEAMKKAAELGHDIAAYRLAFMYLNGKAVPKDVEKAFAWLARAQERGVAIAYVRLPVLARRMGQTADYAPADLFRMLEVGTQLTGEPEAKLALGDFYADGFGVDRDDARAKALYEDALADGETRAYINLGDLYADRESSLFDPQAARAAYQSAVDAGQLLAAFRLAELLSGSVEGVPADPAAASEALEKAVDQGMDGARFVLGRLYADPESPVYRPERAESLLVDADRGLGYYTLGEMFEADTPSRDTAKAERYYRKAIDMGVDAARYRLAQILISGGSPAEDVRAVLGPLLEAGDARAAALMEQIASGSE